MRRNRIEKSATQKRRRNRHRSVFSVDGCKLTDSMKVTGMASPSSSSDSSSELESSSDELVSVDADGEFFMLPSSRRALIAVVAFGGLPRGLPVPLYLLEVAVLSFGGRPLFLAKGFVSVPKRTSI